MFNLILYQAQIPSNTGNIIRLCANTGSSLHLIKPLGFILDDKRLLRAGLDYHEWTKVLVHDSLEAYCNSTTVAPRLIAVETSGTLAYDQVQYRPGDSLLFGAETFGLPMAVLDDLKPEAIVRIPQTKTTRSLNLANCAALVLYEALRQNNFEGLS